MHNFCVDGSMFDRLWCLVMTMSRPVTARAHRNEILFEIVSRPSARAEVVYVKILRYAAVSNTHRDRTEFCERNRASGRSNGIYYLFSGVATWR